MSTTPQIIKDQEFQTKFRGYDPVEVKAYLDMIAEEFFELQERCRLQVEDLQAFHEEREDLEQQKISLEASNAESRKMAEELRRAGLTTEQKLAVSMKEAEALRGRITSLEQEIKGHEETLSSAESRIHEAEEALLQERTEKEALRHKITLVEDQQRDAKKDEIDFKATLAAAQQFCDSMKQKSEEQAAQLLEAAKAEIAQLRQAAHAELSRLPAEIEVLYQKREEVRKAVRATLESYLQNIDVLSAGEDVSNPVQGCDDLFQKIQILEDGSLAPGDLDARTADSGPVPSQDTEADLLSVFGADDTGSDREDGTRI
jgi:DivIVA domain-containing protein